MKLFFGDYAIAKFPAAQAVITDPPYGNFYKNSRKTMSSNGKAAVDGDDMRWLEAFPAFCRKVCPTGPIILFCDRHRRSVIERTMQEAGINFLNDAVWVKTSWGIGYNFRPAHEHILLFSLSKSIKAAHASLSSVLTFPRVHISRKQHMTEKPVELMAELVRGFTNKGDLIVDPFMGVASTGVACLQLGRKFTGSEIRQDYFNIARKRLGQ